MRRDFFIELCSRQVHGGFASDDSQITDNLINTLIEPAIAAVAKTNYIENKRLDGIAYANNSFYTTYKGIGITQDEQFLWKVELPDVPVGLGYNEGVSRFIIKSDTNELSYPLIPLSQNQTTFFRGMRPIPNKVLYYTEGKNAYILTTIMMNDFTASVTMVSGGDKTDMDSELNVPPDYLPMMQEWIFKQLVTERLQPQDRSNEGSDAVVTT